MAKPKADVFLDLLRRSGLVDKGQLHAALLPLNEQSGEQPLADAELVASRLVEAGLITRWQANKLLEGRYKGFFLGKYKLLEHLGSGGMSSVYLAEHVLMQRRVAIKVLPKNRVADSTYLARFHREAQAAAALDHRNIVRAYDVDNEGSNHYLVMEYIEGRDLEHIVREDGPLEYAKAAEYTRQAAEGLAHAHEAGLIHRDVKPANLLVDRKDVIKLLDLGFARFTDEDQASLTVAFDENVIGTADYLAPEQAINSHGVDPRADLYGLGCSLYYLLTGHPPFPNGTLPQRLMMHQKQPPPSIYLDRPDAPPDLVDICLKMMAKRPEARHQSAVEVAQVLTQWLAAHGQAVTPGSSGSQSSGKLVGAVSGQPEASADGLPPVRKLPKGVPLARDSGEFVPPAGMPPLPMHRPSPSDIASDQSHPTTAELGKGRLPAVDRSDSQLRARRLLPKAQSMGESPSSVFGAGNDPLRTTPAEREKSVANDDLAAYLARRTTAPKWLWVIAAGGVILAALLLLATWWLTH